MQLIKKITWLFPIVVVLKKNCKLSICIDFWKLNVATKKRPIYLLLFLDEVLNIIVKYETYSFLDGFFKYHQLFIAPKNWYKTIFIIEWGTFV
jgi:hypothetical protein